MALKYRKWVMACIGPQWDRAAQGTVIEGFMLMPLCSAFDEKSGF